MTGENDELLTRKQVMFMLHIGSDHTIKSLMAQGKLPGMRPSGAKNGRILFWRSDVFKYLEECRNG